MSNNPSFTDGVESSKGAAEGDARLARRLPRVLDIAYAGALLICLVIAVYVFQSVPWDTRLSDSGRTSSRTSTSGMTMPVLISLGPIALCVIWQARKKMKSTASDHQGRVKAYILGLLFPLAVVVGQAYVAYVLLVRGGALAG